MTFLSKYDIIIIENKKGEKIMAVSRKVEREILRNEYLEAIILNFLEKDEQVLLFMNRRGLSNFVCCRHCGTVIKCSHCDVALTLHNDSKLFPFTTQTMNWCKYSQYFCDFLAFK